MKSLPLLSRNVGVSLPCTEMNRHKWHDHMNHLFINIINTFSLAAPPNTELTYFLEVFHFIKVFDLLKNTMKGRKIVLCHRSYTNEI